MPGEMKQMSMSLMPKDIDLDIESLDWLASVL